MGYEIDFLPADKHKHFLQSILSLWMCIDRHAQSTQHNKFIISLQYLKENVKDEVSFADNCQRFLQSDTVILDVYGQTFQITENKKFAISLHYLKKKVNEWRS